MTQSTPNNDDADAASKKIVLWRHPLLTTFYFVKELVHMIVYYLGESLNYRKSLLSVSLLALLVLIGLNSEGSHLVYLQLARSKVLWSLYWVGLGVASSIGLGTGLHTFLLYLGPFIAQVTLAAYECNSLDFPAPPYPDEVVCPAAAAAENGATVFISLWSILAKVRLESFMWGVGTALGELPPYFMARASALAGQKNNDDEFAEIEELLKDESKQKSIKLVDRVRLFVFRVIKKVGFWGILLCASIPNPLFDLAGITCGHFLIPFSQFFGATLIGKAVVKMHLQTIFVVLLFSEHHVETLVELMAYVPFVGVSAQPLFKEWLNKEKQKLHAGADKAPGGESILAWVLGKVVLAMILFFVISIVNSLAQQHFKRLNEDKGVKKEAKSKKKAND